MSCTWLLYTWKLKTVTITIKSRTPRTSSNIDIFSIQVQITLKQTVQYGRNSNLFDFLCLSCKLASLKTLRLNLKALCLGQSQIWGFCTQGHVTPRQIVQYGRNAKSSEILCLYWITVYLKKLHSKLKALCHRKITLWQMVKYDRIFWDFTPVLHTSKYETVAIKTEVTLLRTRL